MISKQRNKRCKACRKLFLPANSLNVVCSYSCAIDFARTEEGERSHRKVLRAERRKYVTDNESVPSLTKKAQTAFNRYIRERDKDKPCICCGRYPKEVRGITGSNWDAGHYRSTGAAPHLRFNEDNCHGQLSRPCNKDRSGNGAGYRMGLVNRIGVERVEALERDNTPKNWTRDDLREIRKHYDRLYRELVKKNEI